MFNPEKLLGGMLRSGMRGRGLGSLASSGAALGLLGIAIGAVEHYMNRPQGAGPGTQPAPPPPPAATAGGPPPPPPGSVPVPPPVPEAVSGAGEGVQQTTAVLLIRAMIAAANADGVIDAQERGQILDKLKTVELSREEHQFIVHELLEPKELGDIVEAVDGMEMARQVYAASLLAIAVDTPAEEQYLSALAGQLGLDVDTVQSIHQQLGK